MSFLVPPVAGMAVATKNYNKKNTLSHNVYEPDLSKHGQAYQELAANNPYSNVNYRKSWMQKVLSGLGFRTNYDAYLEGMNLQAQEYDNALLQKEYDEQYNSPLAQAQREREAGLNPNLTGNVSSGEASPLQDDGNPPVAPVADDLQTVTQFASSVIDGVQAAFSLASGVTDLRGKMLDNRAKQLGQIGQEDKLAFDALLNVLPANSDEPLNYNQLYSQFRKAYGGHIKKRYFPSFVNRALAFQNGLAFQDVKYRTSNSRAGSRKEFYVKTSGQDYSEENGAMRAVSSVLSDLSLAVFEATSHATIKGSKASEAKSQNDIKYEEDVRPVLMANEKTYNENLDPAKLAKNDMATSDEQLAILRNERLQSDLNKAMHNAYRSMFQKLDKLEDNGSWYAPYLKLAISAFLLGNTPSMPISINTGSRTYNFDSQK